LTCVVSRGNNQPVVGLIRKVVAILWLIPCLAVPTALPQAHRHAPDTHHTRAIVHQHFTPHNEADQEFSTSGGSVIWFDRTASHVAHPRSFAPEWAIVADLINPPAPRLSVSVRALDTAPLHGPPRPTLSLRAPPV